MANKGPHILELELVDGYGESSECFYYLTDVEDPIADREDLTFEALADLHKRYPNEKRITNSGYHHWRILMSGEESEKYYNYYQEAGRLLTTLRRAGFSFLRR